MKAVVYHGPWNMSLEDLPKPEAAPGEVLLRMDAVGICGSDVHGFTGESGRRAPGMVMGHEAVGTVVALGPGVTSPKVGAQVAIYNILAEVAPTPEEGDPSFLNKKIFGVNMGRRGAMAEYLAVPAENALLVPEGVDPAVGLLTEPIGIVTHGFHRLTAKNIRPRNVAIVGSGTIGLSALLVARERDASKIAVLDMIPEKLERARSFGGATVLVETNDTPDSVSTKVESLFGEKPDLVVDAVGSKGSFTQCLKLVAPGGAILLIGNLAKEVSLPLQTIVSNEISLIGTYGFDRPAFADALAMVPRIKTELATFIEGRCTLEQTAEVMTRLAKGEQQALKIVIEFPV
ncbi:MAG: zinc-binding dehydrogenase [Verrucomicrobia bacterium]|jgi:L-iditol 2-dehydrogenase|nr:zinc-binding dehydrogenase [Verrucomicrobiota bacterium]